MSGVANLGMSELTPLLHVPVDNDGPVFSEPWQAQAFAMVLALYERGLFTWPQWADALAAQIETAPAPDGADPGDAYHRQWLAALESLVVDRRAASPDELQHWRDAWRRAAERTPHGRPIEPGGDDFRQSGS